MPRAGRIHRRAAAAAADRRALVQGTADAIYQNIYSLENERPEYVVILAGDHIYKMNYRQMLDCHLRNKADLTVGRCACPSSAPRGNSA